MSKKEINIETVPRDQPWTMTLAAQDWGRILSMMGFFHEESTAVFMDFETGKQANHLDIFERFYIQAGFLEDSPTHFVPGSTRHRAYHSKCETACGEGCPKYVKPRKKKTKVS